MFHLKESRSPLLIRLKGKISEHQRTESGLSRNESKLTSPDISNKTHRPSINSDLPKLQLTKSSLFGFSQKNLFDKTPSSKNLFYNTIRSPRSVFRQKTMDRQRLKTREKEKEKEKEQPLISAKSYIVFDQLNDQVLEEKNPSLKLEMASITKIMTFYTVVKFFEQCGIEFFDMKILISKHASVQDGTTAGISHNDLLTVRDLLYGMMLPSGNDAATALAEAFGILMYALRRIPLGVLMTDGCLNVEDILKLDIMVFLQPEKYFIDSMNINARQLGMMSTKYTSSHGNCDDTNFSCANDLLKLLKEVQYLKEYKTIVSTQKYNCKGKNFTYRWKNTNRLLTSGFDGIKTGFTEGAGPCLCASYSKYDAQKVRITHIFIIVLSSETSESRWIDCKKVIQKFDPKSR